MNKNGRDEQTIKSSKMRKTKENSLKERFESIFESFVKNRF
jgi:hypothetical protein